MPGPKLSAKEWQTCLDRTLLVAHEADFVVASGSLPPGTPDDFYRRLGEKLDDTRLVVDTKGEALKQAVQGRIYLLKVNVRELEQAHGSEFSKDEQAEAARELVEKHDIEIVVVSLGAAGVLLVTKEVTKRYHAPVVQVVSKVGAGDSMVAGMVWKLSQKESIENAVQFGMATGTAAVKTPGSELCRKKDVYDLYEKIKKEKH